ncbi:hypothetical protein BOW50_11375 [Solemya velum gill symbiont]|nr:hypothetical protein BOW50_11375 [Solemya velum gill symbiont]
MARNKDNGLQGRGYVRRDEEMLSSRAYRDLKPVARCLLEEFQRLYRKSRWKLTISTRDAARLLNVSEPTASKAFYSLATHGFIILTKGHLWQERMAREWRLTFKEYNSRQPTHEWRGWTPEAPYGKDGKKIPTKETGADANVSHCFSVPQISALPKKHGYL